MKSLLILSLLFVSAFVDTPQLAGQTDHGLEMQLDSDFEFTEMVKIYDYEGNLLNEYELSDVVNNDISVNDHFILEESDFAFNYLGDYYYFSEELELGVN